MGQPRRAVPLARLARHERGLWTDICESFSASVRARFSSSHVRLRGQAPKPEAWAGRRAARGEGSVFHGPGQINASHPARPRGVIGGKDKDRGEGGGRCCAPSLRLAGDAVVHRYVPGRRSAPAGRCVLTRGRAAGETCCGAVRAAAADGLDGARRGVLEDPLGPAAAADGRSSSCCGGGGRWRRAVVERDQRGRIGAIAVGCCCCHVVRRGRPGGDGRKEEEEGGGRDGRRW